MAFIKVSSKGLGLDIVLNAMLWNLGALLHMFDTNRSTLQCFWSHCKLTEYVIFGAQSGYSVRCRNVECTRRDGLQDRPSKDKFRDGPPNNELPKLATRILCAAEAASQQDLRSLRPGALQADFPFNARIKMEVSLFLSHLYPQGLDVGLLVVLHLGLGTACLRAVLDNSGNAFSSLYGGCKQYASW